METDEMTLPQAAKKYGVKAKTLWAAIDRGNLTATKRGRDWFVTDVAIKDWQKNQPHKAGRRRKT